MALHLLIRRAKGKSREGGGDRMGRFEAPDWPEQAQRLWLHAASVGEVMAAQPILTELRTSHPHLRIWVTVITPGGHEVASRWVGSLVDRVSYAPFDIPGPVVRALRTIRPNVLLIMETEIWPNLLYLARRWGAKIVLANGRISDRSYPKYRRIRPVVAWALSQFHRVLAQSEGDAERLRSLGASNAEVAGNAKFDQAEQPLSKAERDVIRADLKLPSDAPVLVVGSTRVTEEEKLVLDSYIAARDQLGALTLVFAPRHVERAGEVEAEMVSRGLAPVRRTDYAKITDPRSVVILDTLGELGRVYSVADVVYIGNSLTAPGGGQNLLQPLAQGKPVIFGPYMNNFRDLAAMAESAGAGFRVEGAAQLTERIFELVRGGKDRQRVSDKAITLVNANRGAAARCAKVVTSLLAEGSNRVQA
jgi:3-deoxy-D-manno-octulosonic-acid transferase